jgi:hypothetical protein
MLERTQLIYDDLRTRYKASLSKKNLADELSVSISTIDRLIASGVGLPPYKKLSKSKNAKVIFNVIDVAKFLGDTIKVVA